MLSFTELLMGIKWKTEIYILRVIFLCIFKASVGCHDFHREGPINYLTDFIEGMDQRHTKVEICSSGVKCVT